SLRTWNGVLLPNISESVTTTCRRAGIPYISTGAASVNDAEALRQICYLEPQTLIYSGAGGQIVSREALKVGPRFLHMHAGDIPRYRGSTTIYYALLNGEPPTVTAFFLDHNIDTGDILARYSYPTPDHTVEIDHLYDAAIRADTLVRLMQTYLLKGRFDTPGPQDPHE